MDDHDQLTVKLAFHLYLVDTDHEADGNSWRDAFQWATNHTPCSMLVRGAERDVASVEHYQRLARGFLALVDVTDNGGVAAYYVIVKALREGQEQRAKRP